MTSTLPSPRHVVTSLISSLSAPTSSLEPNNALNDASPDLKNVFLTLHVIFANELLPALDLLDRGLVSRLCLRASEEGGAEQDASNDSHNPKAYYVRSAQQSTSSSRYRNAMASTSTTTYAVHLQAWTCSCPAFAFAAFPSSLQPAHGTKNVPIESAWEQHSQQSEQPWRIGGLSLGDEMPVCKHLLACALAEYAPMFAAAVEEKTVDIDEWAGWAAGWGD